MTKIRPAQRDDLPAIAGLWNESVAAGEMVYRPVDVEYLVDKFLQNIPKTRATSLVHVDEDGCVCGWIHGISTKSEGFLTMLLVDKRFRGQGIGRALLTALEYNMVAEGISILRCRDDNPIPLDWIIPGTPDHDHNRAPGVDILCPAYGFLLANGFVEDHREVAMYMPMSRYKVPAELQERQAALRTEGIETGRYQPALGYDFDRMCDRLGNEYWRRTIRDAVGESPPRPMITATHEGHIVGFTGPVDRQPSGRGFFMGICVDPAYGKRGIAFVLFNLLMQAFIDVGATFSTLYTAEENHAKRLYIRTGFDVVRVFGVMEKALGER